jgi:hypothetical protein
MHSEGSIIWRASRHFIRRATSFHRPLHPSSWPNFLFFRDFLFCLRNFHVRCSCTQPYFWECTASASIIHPCSVFARPPPFFLLHFLLGHFSFLFLCAPLCAIFLEGYQLVDTSFPPPGPSVSTDLATSCVKNWRNLSLEKLCIKHNTLCMCIYTMFIYSIYLVSDLEGSDNGDPSYGIIYCR